MRAANPILIPRNHRVEQAIQSAYAGDFAPFHRLVDGLAAPYADRVEYAHLETPPRPEEIVHKTFCGTEPEVGFFGCERIVPHACVD
jgi:uncharacterized protein YdiU (UPF0061 family)